MFAIGQYLAKARLGFKDGLADYGGGMNLRPIVLVVVLVLVLDFSRQGQ